MKPDHSIVVVTHSMMEARRTADRVAHFHLGKLLELGATKQVFMNPRNEQTQRFVEGKFG